MGLFSNFGAWMKARQERQSVHDKSRRRFLRDWREANPDLRQGIGRTAFREAWREANPKPPPKYSPVTYQGSLFKK
jgi:hypothetical protein